MLPLVVHGFETSNNIKVRIALNYKGIPFEFRTIDPSDRETVFGLTGQTLTPVIDHDGRTLFDSAAILRYLDANFREGPRLFGSEREDHWAIETWERFARGPLAGPMMEVIKERIRGHEVPEETLERCAASFAGACRKVDAALEGREWLVGDTMTAADISVAPVLFRIRSSGLLSWPEGIARAEGWMERVMAYDS